MSRFNPSTIRLATVSALFAFSLSANMMLHDNKKR